MQHLRSLTPSGLAALTFVFAVACGGAAPAAEPSTPGNAGGSGDGNGSAAAPVGDDLVASCKACLADGKNFTAGRCEDACYMDTYCYGPGNQHALTCSDDPSDYIETGDPGI
jgi:hypothetical protein